MSVRALDPQGPNKSVSAHGLKWPNYPSWAIEIAPHEIQSRHRHLQVPAVSSSLTGPTGEGAALRIIGWTHSDNGLPPWRPFVRETLSHTSINGELYKPPVPKLPAITYEQGQLFDDLELAA